MSIKKTFENAVIKAKNIVISTHIYPDADGIGSEVALCLALKAMGKNASCVNETKLLDRYTYLDNQKTIQSYDEYIKKKNPVVDLFIVVDTNSTLRIGKNVKTILDEATNVLFIDHHPCLKAIQQNHCIDTEAAATGQIVGELIDHLGISFTLDMALPLYTAILIDTSSFRYPTVTAKTHLVISKLMETGIRPPQAYNSISGTKKISHLRFLGSILSKAQTSDSGKIAWIVVTNDDIQKFDSDPEDTHAFINYLLVLDHIEVVCMFRDINEKRVKISLRSTGEADVSLMAHALGGGGHNHAAATIIEGNLTSVIKEVIPKIDEFLKKN